MNWLRRLRYLSPAYRRAEEQEMQEEMEALEAIAGRRELGNRTLAAENARAVWGWEWLASLWRDVRHSLRVLARERSFALVAVLSLGLGIGANAAIFSLIDTLLWRQLPVQDPDRLVRFNGGSASYFTFDQFRAKSGEVLSGVVATSSEERDLDAGGGRSGVGSRWSRATTLTSSACARHSDAHLRRMTIAAVVR
jgi:hypothetical protein